MIEDIQEPEGPNLWDASKATLGTVYFAPAWTLGTDYTAEINESGNLSASLTAATFERWQAQFPIHNTVDLVNGREYYFSSAGRSRKEKYFAVNEKSITFARRLYPNYCRERSSAPFWPTAELRNAVFNNLNYRYLKWIL